MDNPNPTPDHLSQKMAESKEIAKFNRQALWSVIIYNTITVCAFIAGALWLFTIGHPIAGSFMIAGAFCSGMNFQARKA